jgi:hypothetical protein
MVTAGEERCHAERSIWEEPEEQKLGEHRY